MSIDRRRLPLANSGRHSSKMFDSRRIVMIIELGKVTTETKQPPIQVTDNVGPGKR
jgi:hypothetical protein